MSKQHCRSNKQLCLLLRQCCRFGQHCRSNVRLCRKDEISTQNSFDIVAVFGNNVEATFDIVVFDNVASTLLPVWTGFYVAYASVTDDDRRRQTPATDTSLATYTMCRRASNKKQKSQNTKNKVSNKLRFRTLLRMFIIQIIHFNSNV